MSRDDSICIIGAGAGGLSAAKFLLENGYTNITIIEKNERVGGKCDSPVIDGITYDMGALEVTPDYPIVLGLIEKYSLEMTGIGGLESIDSVTGAIAPFSDLFKNDKKLELLKDVIEYFTLLVTSSPAIGSAGFRHLNLDVYDYLCKPFGQFLRDAKLEALNEAFVVPITCYGYGFLDEIPTAYAMKYLDLKNMKMMVQDMVEIGTSKWPQRIVTGYQSVLTALANDLKEQKVDIVLGAQIDEVVRGDNVMVSYKTKDGSRKKSFKTLICASLLTSEGLGFMKLSAEEQRVFGHVQLRNYYTSLCNLPDIGREKIGTWAFCTADGKIVPPADGNPCMIIKTSNTTDLAVVYTNTEGAVDADKIEEQIKTSFRAMTTPQRVSKIYQTKHWNYFAHVDGTQLKSGFYDKLEALQGQHSTYYAGALLNFEDVEKVMEYSKKLVREHFPRRS